MIKRVLLSGLFIALFSMPAIAGEPGSLDKKSRKIITDRVCKRHASKQYTDNEEWSYTWRLVANNMNFLPNTRLYVDAVNVEFAQAYNDIMTSRDDANNMSIDDETRAILKLVDRKCR